MRSAAGTARSLTLVQAMKNPEHVERVGTIFRKEMAERTLRLKLLEFAIIIKKKRNFSLQGSADFLPEKDAGVAGAAVVSDTGRRGGEQRMNQTAEDGGAVGV